MKPLEALLKSEIELFAGQICGPGSLAISFYPVQPKAQDGLPPALPAYIIGPADENPLIYLFKRNESAGLKVTRLIQQADGISRIALSDGTLYEIHKSKETLPLASYAIIHIQSPTIEIEADIFREISDQNSQN